MLTLATIPVALMEYHLVSLVFRQHRSPHRPTLMVSKRIEKEQLPRSTKTEKLPHTRWSRKSLAVPIRFIRFYDNSFENDR